MMSMSHRHEVQDRIRIKIGSVETNQTPQTTQNNDIFFAHHSSLIRHVNGIEHREPYVLCQIFADGKSLCLPVQTTYKCFNDKWNWDEWLTFPLRYCDLPRQSMLALSIHEMLSPTQVRIVGSTTISLFDADGSYRRGFYDLKLWPNVSPDVKWNSSTPGKFESIKMVSESSTVSNPINSSKPVINTANLPTNPQQTISKPLTIAWNDDSAYPMLDELSRIAKLTKTPNGANTLQNDLLDQLTMAKSRTMLDKDRSSPMKSMLLIIEFDRVRIDDHERIVLHFEPSRNAVLNYPIGFTDLPVYDPDLDVENLNDDKRSKLSRSALKALCKDLKLNKDQYEKLMQILSYLPGQNLSSEEQEFIWKYRYFLSKYPKALAKFLQSVHWDRQEDVKEALSLLQDWISLDTEDALELLGPTYHHPNVRSYAVTRLQETSDEDLLLYLLQLVQALRYDQMNISISDEENRPVIDENTNEIDLSTFLIERACEKSIVANHLYWYVYVECENTSSSKDKSIVEMYQNFLRRLQMTLKTKNERTHQVYLSIEEQKKFVEKLVELTNQIKRLPGSAQSKEKKLRHWLVDPDESPVKYNFLEFDPIPLPLDPTVHIYGINPDKITVFPSAKSPVLFVFQTTNGDEYPTIFKTGNDLRQDQLVLQMITLMDRILRKKNIDLKLTSYKVLSTSLKHGFVQFIDSQPLRCVLERHRTIRQYLQSKVNDETNLNDLGIPNEVLDAYVKSCAGYCVVTYLLGVGDRHLDNLLLRDTGQLFHIDFAFILGRDPKPLPQPMRVSKDMMEMLDGERFHDFLRHCSTAFLILREHANVFANLFSLMLDANIPDIALEREKAVKKLLDKFRLDLDDEKAESYLRDLIDSSIRAIVPQVYEYFHKLLIAFR